MSVVVVGLHERDASLDLLGRLAVGEEELGKALAALCHSPQVSEAVLVSTCLRTEVYAVVERFHEGIEDIESFFRGRVGESVKGALELAERLTVAYDEAAARHLFEVASGVDSALLGEGEILRQVRRAAERAARERASGPVLGGLFRHALAVGKRVRSETAIARGATSLAHVAVELAAERLADLAGARALVLGAGEVGESVVAALRAAAPAAPLVVASRDRRRAARVAEPAGGAAISLDAVPGALASADLVLAGTAATGFVLGPDDLAAGRPEGRPLLVIDAGLPRNVDPAVAGLPGVVLLDLDDLNEAAERRLAARRAEVPRALAIVEEELDRYRAAVLDRSVAPLVASLRARAESLRAAELRRLSGRLEQLGEEERALVEEATRRLMAKLLHEPTVQVKQAAGSPRGERLAEALRVLFDL